MNYEAAFYAVTLALVAWLLRSWLANRELAKVRLQCNAAVNNALMMSKGVMPERIFAEETPKQAEDFEKQMQDEMGEEGWNEFQGEEAT